MELLDCVLDLPTVTHYTHTETFPCTIYSFVGGKSALVLRQNSNRSENGVILSPHSVKTLNSTKNCLEECEDSLWRERMRARVCGVCIYED